MNTMNTKRPRKHTRVRVHIQPTSRDKSVFAYIAELGVASSGQIRGTFWSEARLQTCVDRLEKLARAGYLHGEYTSSRGRVERVYTISRKAQRVLPEKRRVGLPAATRRPAEAEIAHLLRTRDVVDLFSRSGLLISFASEHELKREAALASRKGKSGSAGAQRYEVADGRMLLAMSRENGGGESAEARDPASDQARNEARGERAQEVLLEIDGAYFGKRLQAKVASFAASSLPVLWVTGTKARLVRLQALCAPHLHLHPILFADLVEAYAKPSP